MKKVLTAALFVIASILLISCETNQGENEMKKNSKPNNPVSVTFINDVEQADIWILPQTKEILRTTVWGKSTISKLKSGEEKTVSLNDTEGKFIVRIIDRNSAYYAADEITLRDGYKIHFKTEDTKYESTIDIVDTNENTLLSKNAFKGVLGAQ